MQRFILMSMLLMLSSCARYHHTSFSATKNRPTLFIAMPQNIVVHRNLSPDVYHSWWSYFSRVGYKLIDHKKKFDYRLETTIINFSIPDKFISPDLVLYGYHIHVKLRCELFDTNENFVAKRSFYCSTVINNPKEPRLRSNFITYEVRRLFEQCDRQIDHWMC